MTDLFIDARPERVRIVETYTYRHEIGQANYLTHPVPPIGALTIRVPYDGHEYIPRAEQQRLRSALQKAGPSSVTARLGHLLFAHYDQTDLAAQLSAQGHYLVQPLDLPIRNTTLATADDLVKDEQTCVFSLAYHPKPPEVSPLELHVEMRDENDVDRSVFLGEDQHEFQDAVRIITDDVNFRRNLLLIINVRVAIPRHTLKGEEVPQLRRLCLTWPAIPAPQTISLALGHLHFLDETGAEHPVRYDPAQRQLVWGNVPLHLGPVHLDPRYVFYETGPMNLRIDEPSDLYGQTALDGQLEVSLPRLLSRLRAGLFDSLGAPMSAPPVRRESVLKTDFRLELAPIFGRRTLAPYRQILFSELIPEEMRLFDIKSILIDQGFRIQQDQRTPPNGDTVRYAFVATRQAGADELEFYVVAKGRYRQAERETAVQGGQTFTTAIESGELEILLRAELPANNKELFTPMKDFQAALRERFRHQRARR